MPNEPREIKITDRGCATWERNKFRAVFETTPTRDEIADAQLKAGFHPCGYGGPWDVVRRYDDDGSCVVTWNCSGSCD